MHVFDLYSNTETSQKLFLIFVQAAFPEMTGPAGEVWVSYSEYQGLRFANLLVLNLAKGTTYTMYPKDTGIYDDTEVTLTNVKKCY